MKPKAEKKITYYIYIITSNVYQNNLMPTIRICYFQSNKSFMKPYLCFSDLLCALNYKIIVIATIIINTICQFKVSVTSYKATLMIFRDLEKLNFALSRNFCSVMIILSFGILWQQMKKLLTQFNPSLSVGSLSTCTVDTKYFILKRIIIQFPFRNTEPQQVGFQFQHMEE